MTYKKSSLQEREQLWFAQKAGTSQEEILKSQNDSRTNALNKKRLAFLNSFTDP